MLQNFHLHFISKAIGNEHFKLLISVEQSVYAHASVHTHINIYENIQQNERLVNDLDRDNPLGDVSFNEVPQLQQESDLHASQQNAVLQWITHISKCAPHVYIIRPHTVPT
jgi:hypothetical protein